MRKTMRAIKKLLHYAATHPDTEITYYASDMILHVHSARSYLCEPECQSRAGGFYCLTSQMQNQNTVIPLNGAIAIAIAIECAMLKHVLSLAAETEIRALFINAKNVTVYRMTLQ